MRHADKHTGLITAVGIACILLTAVIAIMVILSSGRTTGKVPARKQAKEQMSQLDQDIAILDAELPTVGTKTADNMIGEIKAHRKYRSVFDQIEAEDQRQKKQTGKPPRRPMTAMDKALVVPNAKQVGTVSPTDIYERVVRDVVIIRSIRSADGKHDSLGSGFILQPGDVIVTNEHVIRGAYALEVKTYGGKSTKITVVCGVDRDRDIAVLPVPKALRGPTGLRLETALPKIGEPVYAVGAPAGLDFTFTTGTVSQIRHGLGILLKGVLIQTDASINPGSSGGPLVNSQGAVVGVTVMGLVKANPLNFAVASAEVEHVLGKKTVQALTGLSGYKEFAKQKTALNKAKEQETARERQVREQNAARKKAKEQEAARERQLREQNAETARKLQELKHRWRQLKKGMSKHQVKSLLGSATRIETGSMLEFWYYKYKFNRYGSSSVTFHTRNGKNQVYGWSEPRWN